LDCDSARIALASVPFYICFHFHRHAVFRCVVAKAKALFCIKGLLPRSGITQYVYDQAGHLLAESDGSGNTLTEYVWLDDMPIALVANVDTSPTLYFVHTDHLDRPIRMTDGENVVWDAVYDPFGGVNSIAGAATNNLRFPGQYFMMEDGLHYNWCRHYDPTIGRYIQPDPLGFINGPSLYTYVRNNGRAAALRSPKRQRPWSGLMTRLKWGCAILALAYLVAAFFPTHVAAPQQSWTAKEWVGRAIYIVNFLLVSAMFYGMQTRKPVYWRLIPILMILYLLSVLIPMLWTAIRLEFSLLPFLFICIITFFGMLAFVAWWRKQKSYFV
jgi:RHS repeat-associated protein